MQAASKFLMAREEADQALAILANASPRAVTKSKLTEVDPDSLASVMEHNLILTHDAETEATTQAPLAVGPKVEPVTMPSQSELTPELGTAISVPHEGESAGKRNNSSDREAKGVKRETEGMQRETAALEASSVQMRALIEVCARPMPR